MKKLYAFLHLLMFGLILVHSVIPHSHEEEALSKHPILTATSISHTLLFLQIDLGEDHLEEYDQEQQDFVFVIEGTSRHSCKTGAKSLFSRNQSEQAYNLSIDQTNRGPPLA